jgi:hypothetical protein
MTPNAELSGTETTGMNEPLSDEQVAASRRLQRAEPVSKHAAGRQKALSPKEKARRKAKAIRETRAQAMDQAALRRLEIDG